MRHLSLVICLAAVAAAAKPDYSKLQFKGNMVSGHRQDSFALAVQAAARLFGKETDYEAITAMAGNAFASFRNGHKDNPIHHGSVMWAVAPGEVTLKSPEAEQTMLRQAVDYIRGRGLFAPKEPVVYGLAAMDAWIKHMETVKGYCAPCFGRGQPSWHDAMENGERLLRGARVAAKKLRAVGPQYEAAAKHYDRIVALLAPVKYQEFIGDLDKQKAHAETVLAPVKAELAAAAEEIERALWASAPKAPDPAKLAGLASRGHHPEDPFSLTLQAVAAAFGREVDYDTVFALSSNCFAPDIRPDEECRSTWRLRGRGQCLDLVADRLGLKVRPLGCLCPKYPQARKGDEVVALVRQALADGEVVITDSGWRHDFMLWGIVTGVRDNGKLTGVTPNGRTDNTFDHLCSFWALSPEPPGLSQREADLATLRRAVARIRADREPFLASSLACGLPATGSPEVAGAVVWGLAAMDRWIEQMKRVPYQQDDAGSSAGNARLCALHTLHGAEVAARQLREMAARLGSSARPHVEAVAQRYEGIAALLRPALTGEGAESYGQIMGDAAKQKAHADTVLTPAKAELYAAAGELEKARASAEDPAPGEVKSAVVARLVVEEQAAVAGRGYTYNAGEGYVYNPVGLALALVVALRHAGDTVTYEEFAAASGWAFSFGYRYEDRSTSNLDICGRGEPLDPHDVFRVCLEQRGYGLEVARVRDRETFWAFVKRHVDANTPVVSEQLDGGLIYGYREKGGARQIWFDGPVGGPAWVDADKLQPARVGVLVKRGETPAPEVFLRQALTRVAALAAPHDFRGVPQGVAALEAYAADVADPAKSFEKTSEWFCWATFERLGARGFCAPWLRQTAETLGGDARAPLRNAAEHYERAAQGYAQYHRETRRGIQDKRPFAERLRTPERATALAAVLRSAIAEERAGVEQLRLAAPAGPGIASGKVLLQPIADAYDAAVKARRSMNHARSELVCRLALLHAQGARDVTYEDLVMAAGWGTSFVFHPTKYWLIFTPPQDPAVAAERMERVSGWRWQELGNFKGKPDGAWAALVKTLDAGRGAVGAFLDDYVFAGYEDAARKEDRKVYHLGGWEPAGWWTWAEFEKWCKDWGRLSAGVAETPRFDARTMLLAVMRDAVDFAAGDGRKTVAPFADGAYGLAGMETYAEAVADTSRDPDRFEGGWLGCFCINRQHYAREAAARWFGAHADVLGEPARAHLLKAASHYDGACAAWKEFEAALGRGTGKTNLEDLKVLWRDAAARAAGAAAVRKAAECERQAVGELQAALASIRSDVKDPEITEPSAQP